MSTSLAAATLFGLSAAQWFPSDPVNCPLGAGAKPGAYVKTVYVGNSVSWADAEAHCVSEYNGHLASIHSREQNDCIATKVLPKHIPGTGMFNRAWIGFTDELPYTPDKRTFTWSDGTGSEPDTYTNWGFNEPTIITEGCGQINANNTDTDPSLRGMWTDNTCTRAAHFVCEIDRFEPDCPGTSTSTGYWNNLPMCQADWQGLHENEVQPLCDAMCKSKCEGNIAGIAAIASPTGKHSTCVCYERTVGLQRPVGRNPVGGCTFTSSSGDLLSESCSKGLWEMPVMNIKWPEHQFNIGFGFGGKTDDFPYGTGIYDDNKKADVSLLEKDSDWNWEQCLRKNLFAEGPCYQTFTTQKPDTCDCRGDVADAANHTTVCGNIAALPCSMSMEFARDYTPWTANNVIEACFPTACTNADITAIAKYLIDVWAPAPTPSPTYPTNLVSAIDDVPAPTPQTDYFLPKKLAVSSKCGGGAPSKSSGNTGEIVGGVVGAVVVLGLGGFLFMKFKGRSGGGGLSSSLVANKRGTLF